MAYSVKGTTITLTRGDSMTLTVAIFKDGEAYTPLSTDVITFAVKHSTMNISGTDYSDNSPVIEKTIPYNTLTLELAPADTKNLEFGTYEYDISLTDADGNVDTFITASTFILAKEVHENE